MNNRGQAALVDSIFFLTIVSIICTTLFFFAINYGLQTESQINSFYSRDFSSDILKVITYINVPRDGKYILETEYFQSDYLLALIKEDYADKRKMSDSTTDSIVRTLDNVVKPFDASIDYAFFIASESENKYLFLLLATHECEKWVDFQCENVERKYFYCEPNNNKILEEKIFPFVGKVDSSFGKITLSEQDRPDSPGRAFIIGFSGWIV
ncbi:MAG: hypothetical protein PHP82_04045, partial [Candidatus ainarchaeum sp.]|nr:hypothetical protein [Candidatus ainarchaeum sp.]